MMELNKQRAFTELTQTECRITVVKYVKAHHVHDNFFISILGIRAF